MATFELGALEATGRLSAPQLELGTGHVGILGATQREDRAVDRGLVHVPVGLVDLQVRAQDRQHPQQHRGLDEQLAGDPTVDALDFANQLRRVYDEALQEAIPPDMLELLAKLDEKSDKEGGS